MKRVAGQYSVLKRNNKMLLTLTFMKINYIDVWV